MISLFKRLDESVGVIALAPESQSGLTPLTAAKRSVPVDLPFLILDEVPEGLDEINFTAPDGFGEATIAEDYEPPEPGTYPPREVASALQINVDGPNFDIPSMIGVFNVGAAIYLDVGLYMLFFINAMASADYFPVLQDGAHAFEVIDQQTDYLVVQAKDAGGSAVDVPRFSVQIFMF